MRSQPYGTIFTSSWLVERGYSLDLQKQYKKSNWLESIGSGAMKRTGDDIPLEGALFALQHQLGMHIHIGAKSALGLQGKAHYLKLNASRTSLFGPLKENPPKWFRDQWKDKYSLTQSDFLPVDIGVTDFDFGAYKLKISTPARAIMECLYLAPEKQPLMECYEIMEGLNNLRPNSVQQLLENCNSIKVKRLFLFMAEKAAHQWFRYINTESVDLGKGKRSIVPNGVFDQKYQITLPKELKKKDERGI
ncbi:hypothetical protein C900_03878 [Fulvivirga imtechensis AK7]|uniref:Transcriptional regulator AbiEi antitoxin N-terminal domain-containing protein n=1 Tax=Fulvivirga imtechensis AK7 TaxID=1237149 RepID=L8JPR4_9BACT|nr:hypothetical protein C900_03878 [Fulvivirga imtechensis AK7]